MAVSTTYATNPHAQATNATRWSYFWKGTAIITAIALAAISCAVVGWALFSSYAASGGLLFTTYQYADMAFALVLQIPIAVSIYKIAQLIWNRSNHYDGMAQQTRLVAAYWDTLTETKLQEKLKKYNIPPRNDNQDILKYEYALFRIIKGYEGTERKESKVDFKVMRASLLHMMQNKTTLPKSKLINSDYTAKKCAEETGQCPADTAVVVLGAQPKYFTQEQILSKDVQTLAKELFSDTGTV